MAEPNVSLTKMKDVVLGFLEDAEPWQLQSAQFPSKVGGRPAWLSLTDLPCLPLLECELCHMPMVFLLQVYAPIYGQDISFHRTVFLFCCKTPTCYIRNDSRCMKVFRSQLPRRNEFYPYDPPSEDEPHSNAEPNQTVLPASGIKLCWVCGCPGSKACSRCHVPTYCSKHHQTLHWKHTHKEWCSKSKETSTVSATPFLFPESELVTEPEEQVQENEDKLEYKEEESTPHPSLEEELEEVDLEEMAMHESEDNKVFQRFKKRTSSEPHQVLRYSRGGSALWVSSQHVPSEQDIPPCSCGAKRTFEFQVMPQLLNSLAVDSTGASIDWGTLVVYTCSVSCNHGNCYSPEFIWKQDFSSEQQI